MWAAFIGGGGDSGSGKKRQIGVYDLPEEAAVAFNLAAQWAAAGRGGDMKGCKLNVMKGGVARGERMEVEGGGGGGGGGGYGG